MSGVIGGVVLGIILRNSRTDKWTPREIMYINYLGDLFLRMLKSLILPLIISSLVSAIGSLDLSLSGRIGARAIGYYMVTTICAVILGECSKCSKSHLMTGTIIRSLVQEARLWNESHPRLIKNPHRESNLGDLSFEYACHPDVVHKLHLLALSASRE